jgi:thioredoxin-dependent peroxiredoxin
MKLAMTDGEEFSPAALKGETYVLYFYPKDNTPGCTLEGQDFKKHFARFKKLGVRVFGVSRDSLASHEKFCVKMGLPFPLISDPNEDLCKEYDVIQWKNMYGKKVRGIERSTFVIDEKGRVEKEWRKVKVDGHVSEVLTYLASRDDG